MIRRNDEQHWLYAASGPESNGFLHTRLEMARNIVITSSFLWEFGENHRVLNGWFSLMATPRYAMPVSDTVSIPETNVTAIETVSNMSFKKYNIEFFILKLF